MSLTVSSDTIYISTFFNQKSVSTNLKIAILGDYKENTQIYFTLGVGFIAPYDKWEISYFSAPLGLFHRTNIANGNMFFDVGFEGDILMLLDDYSYASYFSPELGVGIKFPNKKGTKKNIMRVALGSNRESINNEDLNNKNIYYPNGLILKIDFGIFINPVSSLPYK